MRRLRVKFLRWATSIAVLPLARRAFFDLRLAVSRICVFRLGISGHRPQLYRHRHQGFFLR
jgi:hypothetical protein